METVPLRERSKARRRREIQMAGMRLFAERGYEATTIADIAEKAEVAPRTIPAYFPTKLDIALASTNAAAERLSAAFSNAGQRSVVDVFMTWLEGEDGVVDAEERELRTAMLEMNPSLPLAGSMQTAVLSDVSTGALAAELAVERESVSVRVISGMLIGILLQHELLPRRDEDGSRALEVVRVGLEAAVSAIRGAHSESPITP